MNTEISASAVYSCWENCCTSIEMAMTIIEDRAAGLGPLGTQSPLRFQQGC
jgi:hypothetical protein